MILCLNPLATAMLTAGRACLMTDEHKPRRFVGAKRADASTVGAATSIEDGPRALQKPQRKYGRALNPVPEHILQDGPLNEAISLLPANYNFEIHKTVWNLRKSNASRVALQMPEGLLMFACTISDILEQFCRVQTVVMGDVTYGACCIDDFTARALGCDFMVHYAHSCLIPVDVTKIKVLYVFVNIGIDVAHLLATIRRNFSSRRKVSMVGTIQFNTALHAAQAALALEGWEIHVPQVSPLSKGEVLGCTSPRLAADTDVLLYVGDGRFHLESAMIQNPKITAYRYDPYARKITHEVYEHEDMQTLRRQAIAQARKAETWGLILGTLGRQGNPNVMKSLQTRLDELHLPYTLILISEILPSKLALFADIDVFVQVACPRLSIDWGHAFPRPLLSPYEATIALGQRAEWTDTYPMDYYAKEGLGRQRVLV